MRKKKGRNINYLERPWKDKDSPKQHVNKVLFIGYCFYSITTLIPGPFFLCNQG